MAHDAFFEFVLFGVVVASVTVAAIQYAQVAFPGQAVSRRDEGLPMFVGLRMAGLLLFISTLAYLINPEWMAWAAVPLGNQVRWAGAVLDLFSVALLCWTLNTLGQNLTDSMTTRPYHTLVTTGPYHWVRHPYYSTTLVLVLGAALLAANGFIGVLGLILFVLLALRTPKEERKLIERFGDEYRAYMKTTGRFLPRFWRAASCFEPHFDIGPRTGLAPEPLDGKMPAPRVTLHGRTCTMPKVIQFIGGPLDGHRQEVSEKKKPLPIVLHLEISRNTYRHIANRPLDPDEPTTSRATYELRDDRYCFVAVRKPAQKPTAR